MHNRKYFWIIILLYCNYNILFAQDKVFQNRQLEGLPYIENFYEKDYNAYSSCFSITVAQNHFIYVANGLGILEYDGYDWRLIQYGTNKSIIKANDKGELFFHDSYERRIGLLQPTNRYEFKEIVLLHDSTAVYNEQNKNILLNGKGVFFISDSHIDFWDGTKLKSWQTKSKYGASAVLNGNLIVQEIGKGLLILKNDTLLLYYEDTFLKENTIDYILVCASGKILLSIEEKGLYLLENKKLTPFSTSTKSYSKGIELNNGQFLFLVGRDGLHLIDEGGNIVQVLNESNGLCNDNASDLCTDHQGNIWVSTMNGISKIENSQPFRWFNKNHGLHEQIWRVASFESDFYVFTRNQYYRLIPPQQFAQEPNSKSINFRFEPILKTACHDALIHNNKLLVTACEGLFEINKNRAEALNLYKELPEEYLHQFHVSNYDKNRIFIITDAGLASLYNKNGLRDEGIIKPIIGNTLGDDENGDFWVVQNENILQYKLVNKTDNSIRIENPECVKYKINDTILKAYWRSFFSFSNNVYASTPGRVYIFNKKTGEFIIDKKFEGLLLKDECLSEIFLNDKSGNLWLSIADASQRYDYSTRVVNLIGNRYEFVELDLNRIGGTVIHSISQESDSSYWICTNSGLALYTKGISEAIQNSANTYIRKVLLKNDSTLYLLNSRNKDVTQSIKYDNNKVAFEFTLTSYIEKHKNKFQFKLEGADNEWSDWTENNKVNYARLWEGDYCFKVRGQNYLGQVSSEDYFKFTILPPWYRTWYLYCIYVLISIAIVLIILRWRVSKINKAKHLLEQKIIQRTQELHQKNIQLEKQTTELKELDKFKSNFFANISHEFRTPLTLILGPLHELIKEVKDVKFSNRLALINKHAEKLKNQINQILELSRFEMLKAKSSLGLYSINEVVSQFTASFHSLAEIKKIDFRISLLPSDIKFVFDREKIEIVLSNLLSNAFKFTPDGGKIEISLALESKQIHKNNKVVITNQVTIQVKDTGIGIHKEQLPFIFSRFYQADSSSTKKYEGTGIGLALVKEIVEMHQGKVEAQSEEGLGTTVFVTLPVKTDVDDKLFKENCVEGSSILPGYNEQTGVIPNFKPEVEHSESEEIELRKNKPIVLVVEDNDDMAAYIANMLEGSYKVIVAMNGQLGLKEALKSMPDLIISDLMMPIMDGFQLCCEIKKDILTCHIPIILLTAKADIDTKIDGLQTGADDFLNKPFVKEELLIRVKNLIKQRIVLRKKYEKRISVQPLEVETASMDEQFLNTVALQLEKNYSDTEYSVEKLSAEIGFSYRNFHRKIKALTDQNPSVLILNFRLGKAAHLIRQKAASVSEIAYKTGFNDPSYFTKCFKKHFGCLPTEFEN
ncbi:MAG: response regulator [Bacteroidota bacterium]|nr:MAG: response regulator [Bacteroidota bacterium]